MVPSEALSETSRVFLYPADRKLYPEEQLEIKEKVVLFFERHPSVEGSFDLWYDRFLVFLISEQTPLDGKIQDDLVSIVLELEQKWDISLMDKIKVFYKQGEFVQCKEVKDFKRMIKNRSVNAKTIIFNNFIHNKSDFENSWEVPAEESWLAHLF